MEVLSAQAGSGNIAGQESRRQRGGEVRAEERARRRGSSPHRPSAGGTTGDPGPDEATIADSNREHTSCESGLRRAGGPTSQFPSPDRIRWIRGRWVEGLEGLVQWRGGRRRAGCGASGLRNHWRRDDGPRDGGDCGYSVFPGAEAWGGRSRRTGTPFEWKGCGAGKRCGPTSRTWWGGTSSGRDRIL